MTRLIKLFTVRVFETGTPDVDHFGDNGDGNFFRQHGADIKSDRHVYTLEPVSRDAFAFELIRDRTNFPLATDPPDISRISLNRPAQYILILLMPARDDDDVGIFIRDDLLKSLLETLRKDRFRFWKTFRIGIHRTVIDNRRAESGNGSNFLNLSGG